MIEPNNIGIKLTEAGKQLKQLKFYSPPSVEELGDLRSLTLGMSYGVGESTGPETYGEPEPQTGFGI